VLPPPVCSIGRIRPCLEGPTGNVLPLWRTSFRLERCVAGGRQVMQQRPEDEAIELCQVVRQQSRRQLRHWRRRTWYVVKVHVPGQPPHYTGDRTHDHDLARVPFFDRARTELMTELRHLTRYLEAIGWRRDPQSDPREPWFWRPLPPVEHAASAQPTEPSGETLPDPAPDAPKHPATRRRRSRRHSGE
jgi:hypothetical protein